MTTNASASLITALSNSLADSNAQWSVRSVLNSTTTRLSAVVGTIAGGNGTLTNNSETRNTLTVELVSGAVRAVVGSAALAAFTYRSIKLGASFSEAYITINGGEFRSTNSALDTAIRDLATAFMAATDAAAVAALNAGPQAFLGPAALDGDLLAALNASLGEPAKSWAAKSRVENTGDSETQIAVNMQSPEVRFVVPGTDRTIPAQFTWLGRYTLEGNFIEARLFVDGAEWRTSDATLEGHVTAAATAFLSAKETAVIAALEA